MKQQRWGLVIALMGLLLGGCGGETPPATLPSPQVAPPGDNRLTPPAGVPTVAGGYAAPTSPASSAVQTLKVGGKGTLPDGQTITINRVEYPVPTPKYLKTPVLAADVEWCAGPQPTGGVAQAEPFSFGMIMPDNTREGVTLGEKDPSLIRATLAPGDCNRGWVTFSAPVTPQAITFEDRGGATGRPFLIKWELSP